MTIRPTRENQPAPFSRQGRSLVLLLVLVVAVIVGIGATIHHFRKSSQTNGVANAPTLSADELDAAEAAARNKAQLAVPRSAVSVRRPTPTEQVRPVRKQAEPETVTSAEIIQASAEAQEAVGRLAQLDVSSKALTPEQSAAV